MWRGSSAYGKGCGYYRTYVLRITIQEFLQDLQDFITSPAVIAREAARCVALAAQSVQALGYASTRFYEGENTQSFCATRRDHYLLNDVHYYLYPTGNEHLTFQNLARQQRGAVFHFSGQNYLPVPGKYPMPANEGTFIVTPVEADIPCPEEARDNLQWRHPARMPQML